MRHGELVDPSADHGPSRQADALLLGGAMTPGVAGAGCVSSTVVAGSWASRAATPLSDAAGVGSPRGAWASGAAALLSGAAGVGGSRGAWRPFCSS